MSLTTTASTESPAELSLTRRHLMRAGYLLMAVGLALVKWPLLPDAHTLPLYEGVTLCLLTAMSLLALLGLWRPVQLLPVLLFPLLVPLLLSGVRLTRNALEGGMGWMGAADGLVTLSTYPLALVAASVLLFEYVWTE